MTRQEFCEAVSVLAEAFPLPTKSSSFILIGFDEVEPVFEGEEKSAVTLHCVGEIDHWRLSEGVAAIADALASDCDEAEAGVT